MEITKTDGRNRVITATTTDAANTDLLTEAVKKNSSVKVTVNMVAYRTDGGAEDRAGYQVQALFYRDSTGGAIRQGSGSTVVFVEESDTSWKCRLIASGNNFVVRVAGAVSKTVKWKGRVRTLEVRE